MTDPIDIARQEGIALGLAMAAAKADAEAAARLERQMAVGPTSGTGLMHGQVSVAMKSLRQAILAIAPIPPHVAAARVLLDDLALALGTDGAPEGVAAGKRWNEVMKVAGLGPFVTRVRAALEHISKEADQ
jgi:hypothetical protein